MKTANALKSISWTAIAICFLMLVNSCGSGTDASGQGENTLGNAGVASAGPIPEDINELPNTLPDNFYITSCPPLSGAGFTEVRDLEVIINSNAPAIDTDGDGDGDTILLQLNDPNPKLVIFETLLLMGPALPPTILHPDPSSDPRLEGGQLYDASGTKIVPASGFFGDDVFHMPPTGSAFVSPYKPLVWRQGYDPLTPGGGALGSGGWLSFASPTGFEGVFGQGVYTFAAVIQDINMIEHCTENSWKMIICPYSGPVDDNGNMVTC